MTLEETVIPHTGLVLPALSEGFDIKKGREALKFKQQRTIRPTGKPGPTLALEGCRRCCPVLCTPACQLLDSLGKGHGPSKLWGKNIKRQLLAKTLKFTGVLAPLAGREGFRDCYLLKYHWDLMSAHRLVGNCSEWEMLNPLHFRRLSLQDPAIGEGSAGSWPTFSAGVGSARRPGSPNPPGLRG